MKQAQTLSEIHQSCDPRPLRRDELDAFFVETADARDEVLSRRDELRDLLKQQDRAKLLLAGHSGCGKSTELAKLMQEVESQFFTVHFSVAQECNLFHVPVEDVLVVMMERLFAACEEAGFSDEMSKADKTLDPIYDWFGKEMEIDEDRTTAALQAVGGVDLKGSYLQKFIGLFVTLKADIRKAGERLHRVTKEKPHRLSALAERCNVLVREVNQVLAKQNRKLLIVVEDLDKLNLGDARSMFVEQPAILSELSARVICTVPIFLLHSPDLALMEGYFDHVVLPMPRVFNLDGSPCEQGRAVIHEIIARRVRSG